MPLASQLELPERYRVARHIASGGMASVWEAEDLMLGRVVAVKVLAAQYAADPAARVRFQREARTAAQVSDQRHVVTIYDIGEHENEAFIVMEYFAGGTVADRLKAAREGGEPIPQETALRWLREAAAGLDVAHAAGIVHRDVKPANLLLDAQGRLAVADFGIARLADDTQMTQTGQVMGTAAYISPEQARSQPATDASDRYALAVVAYELLTGSRPFRGGPPTAQALAHAEAQPPRASQASPDLPPAIDAVLARGLAKNPDERPRSATELVDAIVRALDADAIDDPTRPFKAPDETKSTARVIAAPVAAAAIEPDPPTPPPAPAAAVTPPRPAQRARIAPQPPREAPAEQERSPGPPPRARKGVSPGLVGAALLAVAAVALVLVLSGGNDPQRTAGGGGQSTTAKTGSETPQQNPAPPPPPPAAQPKPASGGESPSRLAARGHNLVAQKSYAEAIAPLQGAVEGYKAAGTDKAGGDAALPYAFALYDLGVALNRSGNPSAAIPVLEERLKFDNQTQTVMAELRDAQAKAGVAPQGAGGNGKGNGKKDKDDG